MERYVDSGEWVGRETSRSTARIACSIWVCSASWFVVFYFFWRLDIYQPHGLWALASLLSLFGLHVWLVFQVARQIWQNHCRLEAVGWLFMGIAPGPLLGFYWLDTRHQITVERLRPDYSVTSRVAERWASSVLHAKSWQQFSRATRGRHVELLDCGQTTSEQQLVDLMDDRLESMCTLLGVVPPVERIAWVRGSMFGQDARATGRWALCGREGNSNRLSYLDLHEAAHALLFLLSGPFEDTPLLLVEGWAESQSRGRDELIEQLADEYAAGRTFALDDLVGPQWYNNSRYPVYSHGGPFVVFLIEEHSGRQFFELYCNVRQETFSADVESVLGTSWPELEVQFWAWLLAEAERIGAAKSTERFSLSMAPSVNADDWQEVAERFRATPFAETQTVACEFVTVTKDVQTGVSQERKTQVVFEESNCWMLLCKDGKPEEYLLVRDDDCVDITCEKGKMTPRFRTMRFEKDGRRMIAAYVESKLRSEIRLPIEQGSDSTLIQTCLRCDTFPATSENLGRWRVSFDMSRPNHLHNTDGKARERSADVRRLVTESTLSEFAGFLVPSDIVQTAFDGSGNPLHVTTETVRSLTADEIQKLKRSVDATTSWFTVATSRMCEEVVSWMTGCLPFLGIALVVAARRKRTIHNARGVEHS